MKAVFFVFVFIPFYFLLIICTGKKYNKKSKLKNNQQDFFNISKFRKR